MSNLLFHPQVTGAEALRIAAGQGGTLVWRQGRVRLVKCRYHAEAANEAALSGQYEAALGHIAAARKQVEGLEVSK